MRRYRRHGKLSKTRPTPHQPPFQDRRLIEMWRPGKWAELESLALTSQLLHPTMPKNGIDALLGAAAGAAMEMPKLRTMEIWNSESGVACVFLYRRAGTNGRPTITFSDSWGHNLASSVYRGWEKVAKRHSTNELCVELWSLPMEYYSSRSSVISILKLRRLVLNQVSFFQLQWECL